ncbi:MFS transporter [Candidatus Microgenomates bacterium]|nr:MFS transporter [Candidatus Microgenomates bacterium]
MKSLPVKDQIIFAIGGLGENVTFQALTAWLIFFWAGRGDPNKALIPLGLLGVLLGIGRFIEAFDDPLIGHLSDRTKSRWGRRFPYIFLGAPFLALSFFLLWLSPTPNQTTINAIYFFIVLQFFFLTYTIVSAPYEGILPEIAKTSKDRVSTSAWRVLFGVIGAGIGLVGSALLIQRFGFLAMGASLGIIGLIAFWIAILGIRKKIDKILLERKIVKNLNLYQALIATLRNKQFLVFSFAFILFSLGLNLLTALVPFYTTIVLNLSEGWVALFMGILLTSMVISLPAHNLLAKIYGKKWAYSRSMFTLSLLFPLLAFVGLIPLTTPIIQTFILVALIGIALAGQFVFPNAILADVIDYDETKTGLRREAIYYGMQNTLQKFSFALSSLIFGTSLSLFGATTTHSLGIRLIGPIAGFATLIGFLIFIKGYKLSDELK